MMDREAIHALADRILNVREYTADDLGAHVIREIGSGKPDGESVSVILVNAKNRSTIAAALLLFASEL